MKVAVINFSGNVGKTTIAAHFLKPRMTDATIFSIESINGDASTDGIEVEQMKGKRFGQLQEQLMELDNAIIDIGASNVEDFLKLMQQYEGSHEEFDFFLVPTVKERKQQGDTVNTIRALSKLGVPKNKIRLVFNKVEVDDCVEDDFSALFGLAEIERSFIIRKSAVIYHNEAFGRLKSAQMSLGEITDDSTDYRSKLRDLKDEDERAECIRMISMKRLATTANKNLDDVFAVVFRSGSLP